MDVSYEVSRLLSAISSPETSREKRVDAIIRLGNISTLDDLAPEVIELVEQAVYPMIRILNDEEEYVQARKYAASSLGKIGNYHAFSGLFNALRNQDAKSRNFIDNEVVWSLARFKDERSVRFLIRELQSYHNQGNILLKRRVISSLAWPGNLRAFGPVAHALNDESKGVRWCAARALERMNDERAIGPLAVALGDEEPWVRLRVAKALAKFRGPVVVKAFIGAVRDEDADVRKEAIEVLSEVGDNLAVPTLIGLLDDEECRQSLCRHHIINGLGRIGDERAAGPLVRLLRESSPLKLPGYALPVVTALRRIGGDEAFRGLVEALEYLPTEKSVDDPAILILREEESLMVRSEAVNALGDMGDERAIQPLIKVLKSDDGGGPPRGRKARFAWGNSKTSLQAILAVEKLTKFKQDDRFVSALIVALDSKYLIVRKKAAFKLIPFKDNRKIGPLVAALQDEDENIRNYAIQGLAIFGREHGELVCDDLIEALNNDDLNVAGIAAEALGNIGDERAVEPLINLLRSKHNQLVGNDPYSLKGVSTTPRVVIHRRFRRYLIVALGNLRDKRATTLLIEVLEEGDDHGGDHPTDYSAVALGKIGDERAIEPLVQLGGTDSAIWALGKIGGERAIEHLIKMLEGGVEIVLLKTIEPLNQTGNNRVLNATIKMMVRSRRFGVQQKAIEQLVEFWGSRAVESLIEVLNNDESSARMITARALGRIDDERAVKSLTDYHIEMLMGTLDEREKSLIELNRMGMEVPVEQILESYNSYMDEAGVYLGLHTSLGKNMREHYTKLLLNSGGAERAVEIYLGTLNDENIGLRRKSTFALVSLGDERHLKSLINALQDEDADVRGLAAEALGEIGDERAVKYLKRSLGDPNLIVKSFSRFALNRIQERHPSESHTSQRARGGNPLTHP